MIEKRFLKAIPHREAGIKGENCCSEGVRCALPPFIPLDTVSGTAQSGSLCIERVPGRRGQRAEANDDQLQLLDNAVVGAARPAGPEGRASTRPRGRRVACDSVIVQWSLVIVDSGVILVRGTLSHVFSGHANPALSVKQPQGRSQKTAVAAKVTDELTMPAVPHECHYSSSQER